MIKKSGTKITNTKKTSSKKNNGIKTRAATPTKQTIKTKKQHCKYTD